MILSVGRIIHINPTAPGSQCTAAMVVAIGETSALVTNFPAMGGVSHVVNRGRVFKKDYTKTWHDPKLCDLSPEL